jgi:LPS sulfotransferase NodH
VFGTKLMWHHLPELERLARWLPEYQGVKRHTLLRRLFGDPRYVWVRRRDSIRQAVSMWRALQTRTWRETDDSAGRSAELTYSFRGIDHLAQLLRADDDGWRHFFENSNLPVLEILYEEHLEHRPDKAVPIVLEHIGVKTPPGWEPAEVMQRQADALSESWVAAYHRDAAGWTGSPALRAR